MLLSALDTTLWTPVRAVLIHFDHNEEPSDVLKVCCHFKEEPACACAFLLLDCE